jgi:hypothetical protein
VIFVAQTYIYLALYVAIFGLAVWALADAVTRPAAAFISAGKRTKNFWLALTVAGPAGAGVARPPPLGLGLLSFLALGSAVAAIVYLVDVRPAVRPYSGRRGGSGGRTPPPGGW